MTLLQVRMLLSILLGSSYKLKNKCDPEHIIFLQCTSPFRKKSDIDNAYNKIIKEKTDSLLSVTESKKFLWTGDDNGINKAINYDIANRKREQDLNNFYEENGSIYICKSKNLRKYNNRLTGKKYPYIKWTSGPHFKLTICMI